MVSNLSSEKHVFPDIRIFYLGHINGTITEIVTHYKYLGTILDNESTFETDALYKKANQRLFFLRKLNYFHVDQ